MLAQYGIPFVIWYLIVEEGSWALLTCALHYQWFGASVDAASALKWCGVSYDFSAAKSWTVAGVDFSPRFVANMSAAGAIVGVASPAIVPFCLLSLPAFRVAISPIARLFSKKAPAAAPAAAASG